MPYGLYWTFCNWTQNQNRARNWGKLYLLLSGNWTSLITQEKLGSLADLVDSMLNPFQVLELAYVFQCYLLPHEDITITSEAQNIIQWFVYEAIVKYAIHGLECIKQGLNPICTGVLKSGKGVLLKIFLNKATSEGFMNLSPIFTIFNILVNNDTVHMWHNFGCHGNHFGGILCVTIVTKLL